MVVRKLTLAEWFLHHQLQKIKEKGAHFPFVLKVNITEIATRYQKQGKKIPLNALVLQTLGKTVQQHPKLNRIFFNTFWGPRFLESKDVRINFPIEILHEGRSIITAIVIKDTHLKTLEQLNDELKATKHRTLKSFPITNFVHTKSNNLLNRLLLRGLFKALTSSPSFYFKNGGGGVSFSSITNVKSPNMELTPVSYGPTGLTLCLNGMSKVDGSTFLNLGVGFDHNCWGGAEIIEMLRDFCDNIERPELYSEKSQAYRPIL